MRKSIVRIPGTCGEWVQGSLEGIPCLISCAVEWYAEVEITLNDRGFWEVPADAPKAGAALHLALATRGNQGIGGKLILRNPLPRSRGYASSTADVAGTIRALGIALNAPFKDHEIAQLAVRVEPSDGTMFDSLVLFAHRDASFHRPLPHVPPLTIVVLDPGGAIDTLSFNAADHSTTLQRLAPAHRDAFAQFEAGLTAGDALDIARAASASALLHQAILFSELVESAWEAHNRLGALGICRAHSGTIVGLICRPEDAGEIACRAQLRFPRATVRTMRCLRT